MTLNLQCPIELIPRAITSMVYGGQQYFLNYATKILAGYWDNYVFSFEVCAVNKEVGVDYVVGVYHWLPEDLMHVPPLPVRAGPLICSIVVPRNTQKVTRFRVDGVSFGVQVCIGLPQTVDGSLAVYSARFIVTQTNADKTTVQIPLLCYDNVNAGSAPGAYIDQIANNSWGQPTPKWHSRLKWDSSLYAGHLFADVEATIGKSNYSTLSGTIGVSFVDLTTGTPLGTLYSTYSLAVLGATFDPIILVDGHEYGFWISMTNQTGGFCNLYNASIYIGADFGLTKAEVVWRVSKGGQLGAGNWVGSRILLDPTKYSASRYLLRGNLYRSGGAGAGALYLRDSGSRPDADVGVGGIPDAELRLTGSEAWTRGILEDDFQPPRIPREFMLETREISPGWNRPSVLVAVQCPGLSLEARDAILEVPIEFSEGVLNPLNTTIDFTRTKVAIDTAEYDGIVTYYLEVVAKDSGAGAYLTYTSIELLNDGGVVVLAAKIYRDGVQRFAFTPTVGLDYYRIKIYANGGYAGFYIYPRIVISQKQDISNVVSKTRVYVPMITASEGSFLSSDTLGIDSTTATSYTVDQRNTIFLRQDALYDSIAPGNPIRFEAIMSCVYSGSTASVCIYDRTAGAVVAASEMSMSGTAPVYSKVDFAADVANFVSGHEYEVRMKTSKVGGYVVNLLMARLSIAINPFTKVDVWWRVGLASVIGVASQVFELAYLDLRAYNGRSKYYHESVGKTTNATTQQSRVYEQASGAIDSNGDLAWTEVVMTRKRTLMPFDLPSSGYAFVGYTAVVPGGQVGASYIVLQPASVPGHRRPDFWPMFLGDLSGTTKPKTLCE